MCIRLPCVLPSRYDPFIVLTEKMVIKGCKYFLSEGIADDDDLGHGAL